MNKYKNLYDSLIKFRLENKLLKEEQYCETHHIKPIKLGGTNDKTNLVNLLPEEHFKAHVYLCQYFKSIKDIDSYTKMLPVPILMAGNHRYGLSEILNRLDYFANIYSELRNDYSKYRSEQHTNKDCRKVYNTITNKNEMLNKDLPLPNGYIEGWIYSKEYIQQKSTIITKNNKENHPRKGKTLIFNLITFEVTQISNDSSIPDGWAKGFKMNRSNKTIWINNPETKETKMIGENDPIPNGFVRGRGKFTEEQKKIIKDVFHGIRD